ncbi:DUF6624 domain-containing protein [Flavobacterium microcysteis]|uniref:Tetratricopeptide repeat protein n=1 Tax=Flavobacterium microcysteis TaxID=2596891 RepID=A0A501Q046_9FLAO|nr:DUF6624 domain-containing protein [Flavobacterium microcysteis]TPD65795.1 hypothetical protein FJA49_16570 [Flavobacterium microcysteis]
MGRLLKHYVQTITLVFFFITQVTAQNDNYDSLIAQAGLFHLQKDYKNAIASFEKAFATKTPDALNLYKAAGVYSLDNNQKKAFEYLNLAIDNGWTEADWLAFDPYFDYLRQSFPEEWQKTENKAYNKELEYQKNLKFPELRKQINLMTLNDQKLRYKRAQAKNADEIRELDQAINSSDSKNIEDSKAIIAKYGWPKISEIGKDGQNNLWLAVQHADQDVAFQRQALAAMEKLFKTNEISLEHYAFLYDRIQCNLNYKQLYGTQVVWTQNGQASGFRPILKEDKADERRNKIGLQPLSVYSKTYGFTYTSKTKEEAKQNDKADLEYTKKLIDSAKIAYHEKQFQKVYDYYNTASTVMGGMNEAENYEAATLFASIFNTTGEEQYRSISLDFLSLLHLRGTLPFKKLKHDQTFVKFHQEDRWVAIIKNY